MHDWLTVMRWEIMRNITNKTFIISMLGAPFLMIAFGAIPSLLAMVEAERLQTIYMVDDLGIYEEIKPLLPEHIILKRHEGSIGELEVIVREEPDTSFVVINQSIVDAGVIPIYTAQEGLPELLFDFQNAVDTTVLNRRFDEQGIDRQTVQRLTARIHFPVVSIRPEAQDPLGMIIPAAFAGFILMSTMITGTMTFQSVIQEKKDKMAELLLSSVTPYAIMQGKVFGYFVVGIIQVFWWLILAVPVAILQFDIPVFTHLFVPVLPIMLFFAIVGNLMLSALFASMGATMVEDIQEAGNFQGMIMIVPWLPFFFISSILTNPNGLIAVIASYFPLTSPIGMTVRLAMLGRIPVIDVIISACLLLITTWLIIKVSGKIFKTGMLMYGKNATIGEIVRWIRY